MGQSLCKNSNTREARNEIIQQLQQQGGNGSTAPPQQQQQQHNNPPADNGSHAPKTDNHQPTTPFYERMERLPDGHTEVHEVHHVYDGDTLTLNNQQRVRFLGMDAPEVKAKEDGAMESRNLCKKLCEKKSITLVFDGEREDKYQRLLAYIFVKNDDGTYLFVNAKLIAEGLANYYHPSDVALTCKQMFLDLQKQALQQRKGTWEHFDSNKKVVATRHGKCYHIKSCDHLSRSRNLSKMTAADAVSEGLSPCRDCC